jgi:hypothetical protein
VKKCGLAIAALALTSVSFAQTPGIFSIRHQSNQPKHVVLSPTKRTALAKAGYNPDSSTDCAFTFTSGTSNTFLNYCLSSAGNVLVLEAPEGHPEMSPDAAEGYGFCDASTNVEYFDWGGLLDSGNWGSPLLLSSTPTTVKIARTTSDGIWTLTQTITQVSGGIPEVKITMALRNNTGVAREAILMRYADVDADGNDIDELDATFGTAMAYNSTFTGDGGQPFGLSLQNEGNTPFSFDAFSQSTFLPPSPCSPFAAASGPLRSTDGSIVQLYFMPLNPFKSGSAIVSYRGL